jgi:hypothetical protein
MSCWFYYIFPLHILKGKVFRGKKNIEKTVCVLIASAMFEAFLFLRNI